ncbi:hypothetical protein BGW80DRAFT_1451619, partial [Lactifluus volemus]
MIQTRNTPQNSGISAQVSETHQALLQLHVTVLKAHNLPRIKTPLGRKRQFYVTVADGQRTWQTRSVRSVGQRVEWNENIEAFTVRPLSAITVSLFAKSTIHKDTLIGRKDVVCELQHELDIILSSTDGPATEPATVLTITIAPVRPDAELAGDALRSSEKAIKTMETWSSAVGGIKRVMDTVGPIAA